MKIPKSLIGAILVGIAVQTTTTSCEKKDNDSLKQEQKQASDVDHNQPPYDCPACGMG